MKQSDWLHKQHKQNILLTHWIIGFYEAIKHGNEVWILPTELYPAVHIYGRKRK